MQKDSSKTRKQNYRNILIRVEVDIPQKSHDFFATWIMPVPVRPTRTRVPETPAPRSRPLASMHPSSLGSSRLRRIYEMLFYGHFLCVTHLKRREIVNWVSKFKFEVCTLGKASLVNFLFISQVLLRTR